MKDIRIGEEYRKRAEKLLRENPVVDAHLDLAGEVLIRSQLGERDIVKHHYLDDWKRGGFSLIVSSVFVENRNLPNGFENALQQIAALKKDIEDLPEVRLVNSAYSLRKAIAEQKTAILLYMEGLEVIGEDLELLTELKKQGITGASLVWSRKGALANGCCRATEHRQIRGGLTFAGWRAVKKMEELSLFLDISHLNDRGFEEVLEIAERPFIATHSNSRSVYDSYRNLTDEQLEQLAGQGGIAGLNACKYIAGSLSGNHLEMLCRHVQKELEIMGEDHIGYGFDLCDSYTTASYRQQGKAVSEEEDCLKDHGEAILLTAALLQQGILESTVRKITGENFLRYFLQILPETASTVSPLVSI